MISIIIRTTLICLLLSMSTHATEYSDCGSSHGTTIWNVQLLGCDHRDICDLVRGEKTTLDVDFKTNTNSEKIKMRIHGKIGSMYLPFAYPQKDACQNSGLTCPLEAKNYTYHAEVGVKEFYPKLGVDLRLRLMDADSQKVLFCILIPSQLV